MTKQGLLLPGFACTSQIWQPLAKELGAAYALTLVDWPTPALPQFHAVEDFARWLADAHGQSHWDFVIGHSLGGLVALDFVARANIAAKLILVETFLQPPPPFFQNLVWAGATSAEARLIPDMLQREQTHFSPQLRTTLRTATAIEQALRLDWPLFALYGDRGGGQQETVADQLGWPPALAARISLHVVPGACHFPMVENPAVTAQYLREIL